MFTFMLGCFIAKAMADIIEAVTPHDEKVYTKKCKDGKERQFINVEGHIVVAIVGGAVYYKHHVNAQVRSWREAAAKVEMKAGRCDYISDRKDYIRTPVCISDVTPETIGDAVKSLIGVNGIDPDTQIQAIVCFYNKGVSPLAKPLWTIS